jgi:phosphatidylglycerophosphate synthase
MIKIRKKYTANEIRETNREKYSKNGFVGVFIRKHLSIYLTKFIVNNTSITPNQVTFFAFFIGIITAYLLSTGNHVNLIIAGILIMFYWTLDAIDGEVARIKNICSKKGAWIDGIFDRLKDCMIFFGLSAGLYNQTSNGLAFAYGLVGLCGVLMTQIVITYTGSIFGGDGLKTSHSDFFLVRILNKLKIKPQYLALQQDVYLFLISVGVMFNKIYWVLLFFVFIMNFYWIIMVGLVWFTKKE